MSFDVVTLGEAMLRLTVSPGTRLSEMNTLEVSIGGAESNVAVALARMGRSVAWVSAVPTNDLGQMTVGHLTHQGVETKFVARVPNTRMGLYFVEPGSAPRPIRVIYDREGSAVAHLGSNDVPWNEVVSAKAVHITGITPALSKQSRMLALEFVQRARVAGVSVCVDVNYRERLWGPEEARSILLKLCHDATLVILTAEDARHVFGWSGSEDDLARQAQDEFSAKHVALTRGSSGALLTDGDFIIQQPGMDAAVVDRLGSGDAFAAGLILGVLDGDLTKALPTAVAMAVVKLGIAGDHFLAGPADVAEIVAVREREVNR